MYQIAKTSHCQETYSLYNSLVDAVSQRNIQIDGWYDYGTIETVMRVLSNIYLIEKTIQIKVYVLTKRRDNTNTKSDLSNAQATSKDVQIAVRKSHSVLDLQKEIDVKLARLKSYHFTFKV